MKLITKPNISAVLCLLFGTFLIVLGMIFPEVPPLVIFFAKIIGGLIIIYAIVLFLEKFFGEPSS